MGTVCGSFSESFSESLLNISNFCNAQNAKPNESLKMKELPFITAAGKESAEQNVCAKVAVIIEHEDFHGAIFMNHLVSII